MIVSVTTLKEYLAASAETRAALDPVGLLGPLAARHAARLREAAKRLRALNSSVASDCDEAADFLAPRTDTQR